MAIAGPIPPCDSGSLDPLPHLVNPKAHIFIYLSSTQSSLNLPTFPLPTNLPVKLYLFVSI